MIMENICQNCTYWDKIHGSMGFCELQPIEHDLTPSGDVFGKRPYYVTEVDDTCKEFERRYQEAKQICMKAGVAVEHEARLCRDKMLELTAVRN